MNGLTFDERDARLTPKFVQWRCIRCGHKIKTAGDAAAHRQLHLFGPNTCRKVFGGRRPKRRGGLGGGMRKVPRGFWR